MISSSASPYADARERGSTAMRATLLDIASRLLAEEGPQALTMRRVAAEAGCSTTVLYTAFGGKFGLAEALYREGFARFHDRLTAVPDDADPLQRLIGLGRAYRANARTNPNYYGVMFGHAIPGYAPSEQAIAESTPTRQALIDQVQACIDAGIFAAGDARMVADVLWAATHGAVSLELAGFFDDEEAATTCFDAVTNAAGAAFLKE